MKIKTMQDLLIDELRDLYSAESQLLRALPKMAKAASSPDLKSAFEQHQEITKRQVERLEEIFQGLGKSPKGKKCLGMEGLVQEGEEVIGDAGNPEVLDAALIGAAQRVEHYEISGYGTARTHARELGLQKEAGLLQETLDEESRTDEKLTQIAESMINQRAAGKSGE